MTNMEVLTLALATAAALSAIVAMVQAYWTSKAVEANRRQTEAMVRPYVVAELSWDVKTIHSLRIRNSGSTPAFDLSVKPNQKFFRLWDAVDENLKIAKGLTDAKILNEGIAMLEPGSELTLPLFHTKAVRKPDDSDSLVPSSFTLTVSYKDSTGSTFTFKVPIDFHKFDSNYILGSSDIKKLSKTIEKELKKNRKAFKRSIEQLMYTQDPNWKDKKNQRFEQNARQKRENFERLKAKLGDNRKPSSSKAEESSSES
jgi:hypothetical protein